MMLYPSIVDLLEKAGSKYSLVIAASKRAREICAEGEEDGEPLDGARGISKAAEEIADGAVSIINYEGTDGIIEKVLHNTEELYAEAGEETENNAEGEAAPEDEQEND